MYMKPHHPFLILVIALLVIGGITWFVGSGLSDGMPRGTGTWKTYEGKLVNWSIRYPETWLTEERPTGGDGKHEVVGFQGEQSESFRIIITQAQEGATLEELLGEADEISKTAYEGQPSKKVLTNKYVRVGDVKGIERKETWLAAGFDTLVTYVLKDGIFYQMDWIPGTSGAMTKVDEATYRTIRATLRFTNP